MAVMKKLKTAPAHHCCKPIKNGQKLGKELTDNRNSS